MVLCSGGVVAGECGSRFKVDPVDDSSENRHLGDFLGCGVLNHNLLHITYDQLGLICNQLVITSCNLLYKLYLSFYLYPTSVYNSRVKSSFHYKINISLNTRSSIMTDSSSMSTNILASALADSRLPHQSLHFPNLAIRLDRINYVPWRNTVTSALEAFGLAEFLTTATPPPATIIVPTTPPTTPGDDSTGVPEHSTPNLAYSS